MEYGSIRIQQQKRNETTYVALDLDQENTIISYRIQSSDDVDLTVDFYETDDDGNNIRSYESNGKYLFHLGKSRS